MVVKQADLFQDQSGSLRCDDRQIYGSNNGMFDGFKNGDV